MHRFHGTVLVEKVRSAAKQVAPKALDLIASRQRRIQLEAAWALWHSVNSYNQTLHCD